MVEWVTRTFVPIIVGTLLGLSVKWGFNIDNGALTMVVTSVVIGVYALIARLVEQKFPTLGSILMSAGIVTAVPVYLDPEHPLAAPPSGAIRPTGGYPPV